MLPRIWTLPLLITLCACVHASPDSDDADTSSADLLTSAGPGSDSPNTLTMAGLGAVRLGMSVTEVQQALGAALEPMTPGTDAACWMTRRADGRAPQVFYMVENDKITRIDIDTAASAGTPSDVKTEAGIGVGAAEADVLAAYGKSTKVTPNKYDEHGHDLVVENADAKSALLFQTSDGKVTTFRAGLHPSVDYVEGCS